MNYYWLVGKSTETHISYVAYVAGHQELVLELSYRPLRYWVEVYLIVIVLATKSFGNVGGYWNRCSAELASERKQFFLGGKS